jgi:hypothetical protein
MEHKDIIGEEVGESTAPTTPTIPITKEEAESIIDAYISGEPVEKTFKIIDRIKIVLRDPCQSLIVIALDAFAEDVATRYQTIQASDVNNHKLNNLLAAYITEFHGHNFVKQQGDKYNTVEGFNERKKYLLDHSCNDVFVLMVEKLVEFQSTIRQAFGTDNLKNI